MQLTSFVGRGAQMTDVGKLLADNRLVTLTGAGGAGKTRLGIEMPPLWMTTDRQTVCDALGRLIAGPEHGEGRR